MTQELIGKKIINIIKADEEIIFETETGERYKMYHCQDCCESVSVVDENTDILLGGTVQSVSEHSKEMEDACESGTITTYTITSDTGTAIIIWHGESNGYYSETPYFEKCD